MILADLGAEVIKIERRGVGDLGRGVPPHFFHGESLYFMSMNRNKKSMTLDLKTKEGLDIFYRLVGISDVVYDNFRPGIMEKLAIDYETLRKMNPRIICCSVSGYGQTGPDSHLPAFDLIIQARGGIMSYTGEPDRAPVRMGAPMGDMGGGIFAAHGVLAALFQRERTGMGQRIDIGMLDCQIYLMIYRALYYLFAGEIAPRVGSGHVSAIPIGAYRTKTFDIVIDANSDKFFWQLCEGVSRKELASDPRFHTRADRLKNKEELDALLQEAFLEKSGEEWLEILKEACPSGPINTVDRALSDPQILSRDMVVETMHQSGEMIKLVGNPIKMSQGGKEEFRSPPYFGEHTEEILTKLLDFHPSEVQGLRDREII
jgi:crotonobetainyl-CoA:carnitine CoA-transferase CaiB-like acyl-CoA transferase